MRAAHLLKQRSLQVVLALVLYLTLASYLPQEVHQGFYTFSLFIKDLLLWLLPITVCFFIASALSSFEKKAPFFLLFLLVFEALSNSLSVWYAFGCGHLASYHLHNLVPQSLDDTFHPLWRLPLVRPSWWSADKGSFIGAFLGLFSAFSLPILKRGITTGKRIAETLLTKLFSPLIPLFVLGFVAKMYKTHLLTQIVSGYADMLLWLLLCLVLYLFFLFWAGSGGSLRTTLKSIKHLTPAAGVAFSSGCSLSTMPWTIEGTAKNLKDPDLAKAVIPATTNIQQIGDCIANAFLCFLIYSHFYGEAPSLSLWIPFTLVFVLARFATAAILGGAIFIMLPIYESYLHFTPEMTAMILAFNVILDPIVTSSNVIANGALCRLFERTWLFLLSRFSRLSHLVKTP